MIFAPVTGHVERYMCMCSAVVVYLDACSPSEYLANIKNHIYKVTRALISAYQKEVSFPQE